MFASTHDDFTIDDLEAVVARCEAAVSAIRAIETDALRRLDIGQVAGVDGARSMVEWTASRFDLRHDSARELVYASQALTEHSELRDALATGEMTLDRVSATIKLIASGASEDHVRDSHGLDLAGVERLTARHRRITRSEERQGFAERYWASQHSLDQAHAKFWGQLPGFEMELVEKALQERADAFPVAPDGCRDGQPQRMADALVAVSLDALDALDTDPSTMGPSGEPTGVHVTDDRPSGRGSRRVPLATVFVDAGLAAATDGEAGAEMAFGPRVGPEVLDRILCGGAVQVIGIHDGRPVTVTDETRAIPPAVRRFVTYRDGGCAVDGCRSRYRLQPHHIWHRRHGGSNDPDNLEMYCWYHHHVVIHRHGFRIDPGSPRGRRRFLRNHALGPAPP